MIVSADPERCSLRACRRDCASAFRPSYARGKHGGEPNNRPNGFSRSLRGRSQPGLPTAQNRERFAETARLKYRALGSIHANYGLTRVNCQTELADFLGFLRNWSGRVDLNHRPLGPEPSRSGDFSEENDAIFVSPNYQITVRPSCTTGHRRVQPTISGNYTVGASDRHDAGRATAAVSPRLAPSVRQPARRHDRRSCRRRRASSDPGAFPHWMRFSAATARLGDPPVVCAVQHVHGSGRSRT
jgi:hypothetical protein